MTKRNVHLYVIGRVTVYDVESESQPDAVRKAVAEFETTPQAYFRQFAVYAEEIASAHVDEHGDEGYCNSKSYAADGGIYPEYVTAGEALAEASNPPAPADCNLVSTKLRAAITRSLAADGYHVRHDPDQPGKWLWRHDDGAGSDISFDCEDDALCSADNSRITNRE